MEEELNYEVLPEEHSSPSLRRPHPGGQGIAHSRRVGRAGEVSEQSRIQQG